MVPIQIKAKRMSGHHQSKVLQEESSLLSRGGDH